MQTTVPQEAQKKISDALVIFNPRAGRARSASLDRARKILAARRIESHLVLTDGPGAASEISRQAVRDERDLVVVCGGDGTLNEAVNGLAGSDVPLALFPAGTANVLAKELGLPWDAERAADLLTASQFWRIALGLLTEEPTGRRRYFLTVAGAGPDAAITRAANQRLKRHTGTLAYWAEGFRQLALYGFPKFRVTTGEDTAEATLVIVGRTKHYGGPFRITTEADLFGDDFEVMACSTGSRSRYLSYLPLACSGNLRRTRYCRFLKAAAVRCDPLSDAPVWVQVDGEFAGQLPAEFRIVPDALTLAVPRGCPAQS
jgi:YegS/Rv2252/BmrU family lipid kinase